jgi:hypothetical protein
MITLTLGALLPCATCSIAFDLKRGHALSQPPHRHNFPTIGLRQRQGTVYVAARICCYLLTMKAVTSRRAASVALSLCRARKVQTAAWNLPISPGGTLKVRLPTVCTLRVSALDPRTADGGWDRAHITLHVEPHAGGAPISAEEASRVADGFGLAVVTDYEPGKNFLQLETLRESESDTIKRFVHVVRAWLGGPFRASRPQYDSNVVVDVRLPGKFDLDLEVHDGAVEVADTFEGDVKIFTDHADVTVNRLKSMYIDIEAGDGDVTACMLQGNASVRSRQGNIDIAKAQGPSVAINSREGDVQARAVYADYASVRTLSGSVRLGGAQGRMYIRTADGNVEVAGVEGRLDVETDSGDVEAQLSVPEKISLRSRVGDIAISVPPSLHAKLMLNASERGIDVDPSLVIDEADLATKRSSRVHPSAPGKVSRPARSKNAIVRGWLGVQGSSVVTSGIRGAVEANAKSDVPITLYARAPNGEITLNPGIWAGFATADPHSRTRFPRWPSASYPPPLETASNDGPFLKKKMSSVSS